MNNNTPPSLNELFLNKSHKSSSAIVKPLKDTKGKIKFLSKSQREKLNKRKIEIDLNQKVQIKEKTKEHLDKINKALYRNVNDEEEEIKNVEIEPLPIIDIVKDSKSDELLLSTSTHWTKKPFEKLNQRDYRLMRNDFGINIKYPKVSKTINQLNPIRSWKESKLNIKLINRLNQLYPEPTPIQRIVVGNSNSNEIDLIGIAQTGSGKTLAFAIPIIEYILKMGNVEGATPRSLILAPTRELALQITDQFEKIGLGIRVVCIIGGHQYQQAQDKLQAGVEIVVGTPGRLLDTINNRGLRLDSVGLVVLDEADRMVDMGFEEQVKEVMTNLPKNRQTMMFTATMPRVSELSKHLKDPVIVKVGQDMGENVDQFAIKIENNDESRCELLTKIISNGEYPPPVIIFVNFQKSGQTVYSYLIKKGFKCSLLHGSLSQHQREQAIKSITNHESNILIATDVAGRGIDIKNVSLVINYQMSKTIEDYTHRIGRAGRAGKFGTSITFWDEDDNEVVGDLRRVIEKSNRNAKGLEDLKMVELAFPAALNKGKK
ncbi:mRNA splicing protein [Martiniozyma asiatica (nom. inval.)]|nr:mRNA splicing protein [Martiniozyma asiatica]